MIWQFRWGYITGHSALEGPPSTLPTAPVNTTLPVISGSIAVGATLTTTNGIWSGFPAPTFTYQWKRGGSAIGGATSSTYLLVTADIGTTITVTVTATNGSGSASATSAGVGPITSLSISGTPVTTGTEYEHGVGSTYAGFTVTASSGTAPYTYSVAAGTLPSGITLNSSTGAVTGTPAFESAGTYSGIVIRATDASSVTADLASFTLTIAYKDPYYSSTKLLLDHNAADATNTFTDASAAARGNALVTGDAQHDTGVAPPYGTSWFLFDGAGDALRYADSNDWNLGTQLFTLDAVIRPNTITGQHFIICQWAASGTLNFAFNQNVADIQFAISLNGTAALADVNAASALAANTTYYLRLDFDGTKYRLYKNGTMVASSTTLRSIFTGSTAQLCIGASSPVTSAFFSGWMKGIRITIGVARTASDSGYTISNRALPTS